MMKQVQFGELEEGMRFYCADHEEDDGNGWWIKDTEVCNTLFYDCETSCVRIEPYLTFFWFDDDELVWVEE